MSQNRFVWTGMAEFRDALRTMPDRLRGQADHLIETRANAAAFKIRSNYGAHIHTGRLQSGVVVQELLSGRFGVTYVVKSTAHHAHLFENGTAARHTSQGKYRGIMPPAPPVHAFLPEIIRQRRRMFEELAALLMREGLLVSGAA